VVSVRAVAYDAFGAEPYVTELADPVAPPHGAVVRVLATGVCRSDWHGWQGHDADIAAFPHVPGHELAGVVEAVGAGVRRWRGGERVTAPFVCACGACAACATGNGQVCERQTQPGFTHWGSWAERVRIDHADVNLVALPEDLDAVPAAVLGCRVATAYRAVVQVGRVAAGEWVAVFGCGGLGLAAVLIARAAGARVVAVDPDPAAQGQAEAAGADAVLADGEGVAAASGGGVHLSLDAVGHEAALGAGLRALRRRGRHVQAGLLPQAPRVPMDLVIARELEVLGSHGMAAHAYPALLALRLPLEQLVTRTIALEAAPAALTDPPRGGVTVIVP
jgi:D-arabinose 1-dehydrogenase-like Zn-dependent alcohol dehydrogenase